MYESQGYETRSVASSEQAIRERIGRTFEGLADGYIDMPGYDPHFPKPEPRFDTVGTDEATGIRTLSMRGRARLGQPFSCITITVTPGSETTSPYGVTAHLSASSEDGRRQTEAHYPPRKGSRLFAPIQILRAVEKAAERQHLTAQPRRTLMQRLFRITHL